MEKGRYKKRTYMKDQTRFSLRLDDDLVEWVEKRAKATTKNRYINGLIRQDMEMAALRNKCETERTTMGETLTLQRKLMETFEEEKAAKEAEPKVDRRKFKPRRYNPDGTLNEDYPKK